MPAGRVDDPFTIVADALPQIIWSVRPDGVTDWVSQGWFDYTGLARDSNVDMDWSEVMHPDDVPRITGGWAASLERGKPYEFEYRLRGADGRYRWFLAQSTPLRNADGAIVRWYGISTGTDALKRAEESFRATVEALPQIVWVALPDGSVSDVNSEMVAYTGMAEPALVGTGWIAVVHPDDVDIAMAARERGEVTQEPTEWIYRLRRHDGVYRHFLSRAAPVRDGAGELIFWIATCTDIDDQVRARESFELLADTVPQFLCTSRSDGTVEYANAQFRAYTGIDPTSFGFEWAHVVHPDDLPRSTPMRYGADPAGAPVEVELRIRRADGVYRWFLARVTARPDGAVWYTSAADVHERKRASDALTYLDEVSDVLSRARDLTQALDSAAQLAVPRVADWCAVYLTGTDGLFHPSVIHHSDPARRIIAHEVVRRYPFSVEASREMIETRAPNFLPSITQEMITAGATDALHAQLLLALDLASAIVVPLVVDDEVIGMVHLVRGSASEPYVQSDVEFAQVLAKRIAVAIDNAMVYDRARNAAHTFQSAALPRELPRVKGLELDAVYVAGEREAEVGGDWYDAVMLADGTLMISIGDVAGKGLEAAVLMASLRQAIRVAALQGLGPAEILRIAQMALIAEQPDRFATAFVGKIAPDLHSLVYASAGHPPPMLRVAGGNTTLAFGGPPLGVSAGPYAEHRCELDDDRWLLACYTDGLTEATGDVMAGEALVARIVADDGIVHTARPAMYLRERAVEMRVRDDTAIFTIRRETGDHWRFRAADALLAERTRRQLIAWLAERGEGDLSAAEVIYGELISNVVRHAPGAIDVDCMRSADGFRLYVQDGGTAFDLQARLPADIMSESGRGLFIVNSLGGRLASRALPVSGHEVSVDLPLQAVAR